MLRTLLAPNPSPMTLDGTRAFVVGRERPVVIDPGPDVAEQVDALLTALGGRTPVAILLTHGHGDHADAAPALAARTGAPVRALRGVAEPLRDGDAVESDAGTLVAVSTPGHSPDHLCFHWRGEEAGKRGVLFAGDLFLGQGDTTLVAPPEGDLADYLRSLDRVEALAPGVILPAHGPAIDDPLAAVTRYRAHRMQRILQVADALRRLGPSGPGALLDEVYGAALHPGLRAAAEGSLSAILGYLRSTGRALHRPDGTFLLTE